MQFIQEPRSSFHTREKQQLCYVTRNPFSSQTNPEQRVLFYEVMQDIHQCMREKGNLTLCKVLKIGQFLPVSVQSMLCCLRIEVETASRKNHTVQSPLPGINPACAESAI